MTEMLQSAIHNSIIDGVLDDCPHYFSNWCEIAAACAADEVAARCFGPRVVLPALTDALTAATEEGTIDNQNEELERLAAAVKPHVELHAATPQAVAALI